MPGKNYTALFELAADQYGYLTTGDAEALHIPAKRVAEMAEAGLLVRVAHGTYRFPIFPPHQLDQYMEATLWPKRRRGILSHATALDLHELCDVNPQHIHLTVPTAYRTNAKRHPPKLYELHHRDLADAETTLYEGIPIVTPYRAILDGIETHLRGDLIDQAIDTARRRGLLTPEQLEALTKTSRRESTKVAS